MSDRPGLSLASSMRLFQQQTLELSGRQINLGNRLHSHRYYFGLSKSRSNRLTRSHAASPARPFAEEQVNGVGFRFSKGNSSQKSKQFCCITSQTQFPSSSPTVPHPKPISTAFSLQPQTTCDLSLSTDSQIRVLQTRAKATHPLLQTRYIHFKSFSLFEQFPMVSETAEMHGNERYKGKTLGGVRNIRGRLKRLLSSPRTGLGSKSDVLMGMTVCGNPVKMTSTRPTEA